MQFTLPLLFRKPTDYKISYAQNGEDIIIGNILQWLNIDKPVYLDIGTYHPSIISNTYKLYKQGHAGICVEPNPSLFAEIKRVRKRDTCLNVGVSDTMGKAAFYIMANKTLNTLSREQAYFFRDSGQSAIEQEIEISIVTISHIIQTYLSDKAPHFVSLDIEGLDFQVLQSIDFEKYRPQVFCLETKDAQHNKNQDILQFMEARGYFICADTFINSIFVEKQAWEQRER
jgi:FkbM family methyltransferase